MYLSLCTNYAIELAGVLYWYASDSNFNVRNARKYRPRLASAFIIIISYQTFFVCANSRVMTLPSAYTHSVIHINDVYLLLFIGVALRLWL